MMQTNPNTPASSPTGANPNAGPGKNQLLFAFLACVGACIGWHVGVRPLESKLIEKQAEFAALTVQLAQFQNVVATEPPLDATISALTGRARRVNLATSSSGDATRLYDDIHDIARTHGVKVARIEPGALRVAARSPTDKGFKGASLLAYSIEVTGTYEAVCKFVDSCDQELGVSRVSGFHVASQNSANPGKDPIVTGIVETVHLKLAIPGIEAEKPNRTADAAPAAGSAP